MGQLILVQGNCMQNQATAALQTSKKGVMQWDLKPDVVLLNCTAFHAAEAILQGQNRAATMASYLAIKSHLALSQATAYSSERCKAEQKKVLESPGFNSVTLQ